jgi:hypothetical protein
MQLWKVLGVAGLVGITAGGVIMARRSTRQWTDFDADEVRSRLHERFDATAGSTHY